MCLLDSKAIPKAMQFELLTLKLSLYVNVGVLYTRIGDKITDPFTLGPQKSKQPTHASRTSCV